MTEDLQNPKATDESRDNSDADAFAILSLLVIAAVFLIYYLNG